MDSLFLIPFLVGLPLAVLLPLLGNLLRLRDEWLAALGLAHLAGAAGLVGLAAHIPAVFGAAAGALAGGALKYTTGGHGNSVFALMILAGWSATLLIAANSTLGESLAHAMVDGQLFFTGLRELAVVLPLTLLGLAALPGLTPRLIRARLFPRHDMANALPGWRWQLSFDLLAALALATGTAALGLMVAFALVFLPAWLAFLLAPSWRIGNLIAAGAGLTGYVIAFSVAIRYDQPFGPVLVACLAFLFIAATAIRR